MESCAPEQFFGILDLIGQGFNKEVCVIDWDMNILWVNSVLEKKGFHLGAVKNTPYYKTFDNLDKPAEDDPTYESIKKGRIINTIKTGSDMNKYQLVVIPIKDCRGRTQFAISFARNIDELKSEETQKLKDFIFNRELKMADLKARIRELQNNADS